MAENCKSCDLGVRIAALAFASINKDVSIRNFSYDQDRTVIITDTEPKNLVYPEGWYFANGYFTNKHMSTTGNYEEMMMCKKNGNEWKCNYCTLDT